MLEGTTIKAVRKLGEKSFEVDLETKLHTGKVMAETVNVNTILVAIGRDPRPDAYSGIGIDLKNGKIVGRKNEPERTSIDHIYAVGDAVLGVPELMPVAQKSGRLLAKRVHLRLSKNEPSGAKITEQEILDKYSTDYNFIPTTVFSPTEYSFIGLSEEEAEKAYGKDSIEVYHRETTPL